MRQSRGLNYQRTQVRNKQNVKNTHRSAALGALFSSGWCCTPSRSRVLFSGERTAGITQNNGRAADNGESNFLKGQQPDAQKHHQNSETGAEATQAE
jgi:hypothetical protein